MTAKVSITKVEPNTSDFGISQSQVIVNEVTGELYTRTLNNQVKRIGADTAFTPSGSLSALTVAAQLDKFDVVTDRATLQAWPAAPIANKLVLLLGFTTPGDGGQGILYWSAASVVADDGGITTKLTAVTTGRFIKIF